MCFRHTAVCISSSNAKDYMDEYLRIDGNDITGNGTAIFIILLYI